MTDMNEMIWVEKYRPRCIDDCILPARIKSKLHEMISNGNVKSYTACGLPGSGKTSSARALLDQIDVDYMIINASSEGNIDTIRTKVVDYASKLSLKSNYKVIILDEGDGMTLASQKALRGVIEEFAANCRFIITANYSNKIEDAIKSRCPVIEFNFTTKERNEMITEFTKRMMKILSENNVTYDLPQLGKFCLARFPDFRKTINLLQQNVIDGVLNISDIEFISDDVIGELVKCLKSQNFNSMKKWVAENLNTDGSLIRRALYNTMYSNIQNNSIPELIMILNEYDYKESFVVDKEINLIAMLTSIMLSNDIEFK